MNIKRLFSYSLAILILVGVHVRNYCPRYPCMVKHRCLLIWWQRVISHSVEERLPINPKVIPVVDEIGTYGGTSAVC